MIAAKGIPPTFLVKNILVHLSFNLISHSLMQWLDAMQVKDAAEVMVIAEVVVEAAVVPTTTRAVRPQRLSSRKNLRVISLITDQRHLLIWCRQPKRK